MFTRGRLGIFHHRAAPAGVDGDDRRLQHMDRLHRGSHGVGNIVELEIKEDWQSDLRNLVNPVVAMGIEELEPQLQPADMVLDLAGEGFGGIKPGNIERKIDWIGVHIRLLACPLCWLQAGWRSLWAGPPEWKWRGRHFPAC